MRSCPTDGVETYRLNDKAAEMSRIPMLVYFRPWQALSKRRGACSNRMDPLECPGSFDFVFKSKGRFLAHIEVAQATGKRQFLWLGMERLAFLGRLMPRVERGSLDGKRYLDDFP
jgi:hypothetical protein